NLATVTIQTPANSDGILRIQGTTGSDTITLSSASGSSALHVVINGSALPDVDNSTFAQVRVFGQGGNDSFTVAAGLPAQVSIVSGTGNDTLVAGASNLSFNGGGG